MSQSLRDELGKRRPFEHPEQEAWINLMRSASVLDADFERLLDPHGLSMATYNVLRIVRGESAERTDVGIPCQMIGARLITRVPDVTRLVDRLERAGLVKRQRTSEDRRVVLVALTRKGMDLLARLDDPVRDLHKSQMRHLTKAEITTLSDLLYKLRHPGESA